METYKGYSKISSKRYGKTIQKVIQPKIKRNWGKLVNNIVKKQENHRLNLELWEQIRVQFVLIREREVVLSEPFEKPFNGGIKFPPNQVHLILL